MRVCISDCALSINAGLIYSCKHITNSNILIMSYQNTMVGWILSGYIVVAYVQKFQAWATVLKTLSPVVIQKNILNASVFRHIQSTYTLTQLAPTIALLTTIIYRTYMFYGSFCPCVIHTVISFQFPLKTNRFVCTANNYIALVAKYKLIIGLIWLIDN